MTITRYYKELVILSLVLLIPCYFYTQQTVTELPRLQTVDQVSALFPKTAQEIKALTDKAMGQATKDLELIYTLKDTERTFDNTVQAFDRILAAFQTKQAVLQVLSLVSPDQAVRNAAHESLVLLQNFYIDNFGQNQRLYKALDTYNTESKKRHEQLRPEQEYFLKETLDDYKRAGLCKPDAIRERIKIVQKKLAQHELNFEKNIAQDNRFITVPENSLAGLDAEFIKSLKKTPEGNYTVTIDSPTVTKVLSECGNEATRKALWKAYSQRGYPANKQELTAVISLRHELAQLLDYDSYAHCDIDNQMAHSVEKVEEFLHSLIKRCEDKVKQEITLLKADLPAGVHLVNNKFNPWDIAYIKHYHKKKLAIDEFIIAQYFPLDYTLDALLSIYEQFFGLKFKKIETSSFWHPEVIMLAVYKNGLFMGTILLDLFPRENKYNHACQVSIAPGVKRGSSLYPSVIIVIANFPRASQEQPALLKRDDVITFFHEFGHALHSLLGTTELACQAGTNVKRDFVEMPSQMLEQWMWQPEILKLVSKHYKTGDSLPDELIEKISKLKNFDSGDTTQGQICLALTALELYKPGSDKDICSLWRSMQENLRPHIIFDIDNHRYCSFNHLMSYGAKYYGYLWSQVFALDLFNYIKHHGLLNNTIGERYIQQVIGKGGSQDPQELLTNFLGRQPTADAFFAHLGV